VLIIEWCVNGESGYNHYQCGYPPFSLEEYTALIEKYKLGE